MLVVHPNSTCDVCLEGYTNGNNIPHSISCGHVFCLRCLQSLTRLICPLCRTTFDPTGIRRLHVDKSVQSISATTVAAVTPAVADPEVVGDVRRLEDKIDHIVLEGASLTDVRNTIDEVHAWLKSQPKEEHRDLRASHRLLYRVTEDRTIITNMEKKEEEMKMRLVEAERLMEDIAQKRKDEATVAFAVEKSLREHYNRMNAEWNAKYEVALAECNKLYDELERLRSLSLRGSVQGESALFPSFDSAACAAEVYGTVKEHMTATMDKLTATMTAQEDMFKLSPLPSTLHCPTELPPDSDAENDEPLKKTSGLSEAYSRQSIPAISIKPTDTPSSGSLLSSRIRDHDIAMASSLPRAGECDSIHSFMGKRQSSPPRASSSMLQSGPPDPFDINGDVIMGSASLPRHSFMRESKPSSLDPCADEQGNYDRWRRELRDLLHDDHVPPLSRRGSYTRPSSPPRFIGDSTSRLFVSRARIDGNSQFLPIRGGRERSNSDERAPPTSSFQFTVSHPPSPPPVPVGPTSPVSPTSTTVSPTSPPSAQLIPRPSLISRASSAAREAETRARAAAGERHRRESGGSTTSLSSIASSSSGRPSSALREQPSEALSRRGSLANNKPRSHAIGVQALS